MFVVNCNNIKCLKLITLYTEICKKNTYSDYKNFDIYNQRPRMYSRTQLTHYNYCTTCAVKIKENFVKTKQKNFRQQPKCLMFIHTEKKIMN